MHSISMSVALRNARDSRVYPSPAKVRQRWAASVRLSQLRKMRECEQVAAVCYRVRNGAIEFLLVQTRGSRRWTFPKGKAEAGLTHAQAAALEASEEAGVHGRIEEAAFVRYVCRRQDDARNSAGSSTKGLSVSAHLCEVLRLCPPKESNRNRTWFSAREAKRRLREGRKHEDGAEFTRVVSRAVTHIQRLRSGNAVGDESHRVAAQKDELRRVRFEASADNRRTDDASLLPLLRRRLARMRQTTVLAGDADCPEAARGDVLPFGSLRQFNRSPKLLSSAGKVKALSTGAKIP